MLVMARGLRRAGSRRGWLALSASAIAIAALVLFYYADTYWGVRFGRGRTIPLLAHTAEAFAAHASWSGWLLACFVASIPLALLYGQRRGAARFAIAGYLVASFLAVPAMLLLARRREYYFHFRHTLFLLPHFALVTATGLAFAMRGLSPDEPAGRRARWHHLVGIALLLVVQAPAVASYLANPDPFFARTKTLRDLGGLMERLRSRLETLAPGEKYLLIAERRQPGYLANPSLAEYLAWHRLDDRILLRGTNHPEETLREVARRCADGCRERDVQFLPIVLRLPSPFGIRPEFRALLDLPAVERSGPARLGGVGILYWEREAAPDRRPERWPGYRSTARRGWTLFELRGFPPGPG
jgi:hypothetical protein